MELARKCELELALLAKFSFCEIPFSLTDEDAEKLNLSFRVAFWNRFFESIRNQKETPDCYIAITSEGRIDRLQIGMF